MQEAWTRVDGRLVRSRSTGVSDLPEIVIVPGLGAPSYVEPWARELGGWTRATVLDLPGWRAGRGRASPSTVDGVARATTGWLQETDGRHVVLVGHSSGAQSAIRTALAVRDRLAGLVLGGPTLEPAAHKPATLVVRFFRTIYHEKWSEVPTVVPWHLRGGFGWLRLVRSLVHDRPEEMVGKLDLPVLVLTGLRDRSRRPSGPSTWPSCPAAVTRRCPGRTTSATPRRKSPAPPCTAPSSTGPEPTAPSRVLRRLSLVTVLDRPALPPGPAPAGRPDRLVGAVAKRRERAAAAPAQRHHPAAGRDRGAVRLGELEVAAQQDGPVRVDGGAVRAARPRCG